MIYISTSCLKGEGSVFNRDVFKVLEAYKQIGVKNIELASVHSGRVDLSRLKKYKEENDADFIVHGVFPPGKDGKERFMLNLASQNKAIAKSSLDFMKNSIDVCNEIEAGLYSFHPGYISDMNLGSEAIGKPCPYGKAMETAISNIQALADYASGYGLRLAVENTSALEEPLKLFCRREDFELLLNSVNKKSLGLLLDIGHMHFASRLLKFEKGDFIKGFKERIFEMHIHRPGKEKDEHLKIDEETLKGILQFFDKGSIGKIKLTLESIRLEKQDILDCITVMEKSTYT